MKRRTVLCLCMDVTEDDIRRAIDAGFDDIETVKRYTAVLMGPCQGKSCLASVLATFARLTGTRLEDLRVPTPRPPVYPISLGELAADDD